MVDTETANVENEYNLFLRSFDLSNEEEKQRAGIIINYIIRQLNNESLRGVVDYYQYRTLVLQAVRGLFKLIYLDFFDATADEKRMERLVHADVVFASSENFMLMLFTRVFMGKDRELIVKQIEAARPLLVSKQ